MAIDVCSCRELALYEGTEILCVALFIVLMVRLDLKDLLAAMTTYGTREIIGSSACLRKENV